ncbi:poly(ADP-ribose) polymerase family WGR domain protein (macronuclear) [Tetrahymena thermophila SB210]|uniref:Poly [ADP-ribose] polymerase n=1 Tax=Tetrahymena thermophila (strain SB210) TaxID=312017 RepID=Q22MT0_TETTS|nr:poly(ADP-ribose) polymerase family WGR domain protein [Tetrahymena thermophila SB210]EAR86414.2 poly(ADP-ribose) polymerase family WGR domain protein [Tetrahymena thermophila SB210]|eukprot:XP_976940.2 poly(ADP-ribose) polymerase family WGR domain protein [Tetrahymena thermophila SB210]
MPPKKNQNKRSGKDRSLSPQTASDAKQDPVKKVKDEVQDLQAPVIVKSKCPVDMQVPGASSYQVLQIGDTVYSFTLNQTNCGANNNKFYLGQILYNPTDQKFRTFYKWGRVGTPGQNSNIPQNSLEKAIQDYQKKKNDKIKGGYTEIFIKYGDDDKNDEEEEQKQQQKLEDKERKQSKLSEAVQIMINEIFDSKMIQNSIKDIGFDQKKMPLGKLAEQTIKQAYLVLNELMEAIKNNETSQFERLSSSFYSYIPHDFGFQKMSHFILRSEEQVKQKLEMLQNLEDLKIATNLLKLTDTEEAIIDENYKKLKSNIEVVKDQDTRNMIINYINEGSTYRQPQVLEIYEVNREGEDERYTKDIGNDTLLWHGSRISNFVGILSQGLRIAPPEAPVSGYNYGKGIYLADMFDKSRSYCQGNSQGVNYIMLIQAALGNPNRIERTDYNASNLPQGTNSCWGWGTFGPEQFITHNGVKVPHGKPVTTQSKNYMTHNEFIIYKVEQAKIKYLIRFK